MNNQVPNTDPKNDVAGKLYLALKEVEFGFNHNRCKSCSGWMVDMYGETDFAHTIECPVNIALSAYEGVEVKIVRYPDYGQRNRMVKLA